MVREAEAPPARSELPPPSPAGERIAGRPVCCLVVSLTFVAWARASANFSSVFFTCSAALSTWPQGAAGGGGGRKKSGAPPWDGSRGALVNTQKRQTLTNTKFEISCVSRNVILMG